MSFPKEKFNFQNNDVYLKLNAPLLTDMNFIVSWWSVL